MALPAVDAVHGSSLPESVCGKDERYQVQPMTSPPYKWICYLTIESASGKRYVGSGFVINLPDVDRAAVVTSGHCTFVKGAYATRITVKFPGMDAIEVGPDDLYASPEYIKSGSADYDYGLIVLPGPPYGLGWATTITDDELNNRLVTNCGYPADKPAGTMWITGGAITSYTANRIFYMNDTMAGQSGSPVYTWYGGYWTVIGVHSYGGCPNSAPRFTNEMICRFLKRIGGLRLKSLRSVEFPDVYVRCDGTGVTKPLPRGGGTVNCQYKPPSLWERFYIHPVEMTPALERERVSKVVIESAQFPHVFIRMDGSGMSKPEGDGGGVVNCQSTTSAWESFFLRQEANGGHSFQNVQFPHCYIRLDGGGVSSPKPEGAGTVNCQWYDNPSTPASSWESFYVEEKH